MSLHSYLCTDSFDHFSVSCINSPAIENYGTIGKLSTSSRIYYRFSPTRAITAAHVPASERETADTVNGLRLMHQRNNVLIHGNRPSVKNPLR
jgi:hypothetical protein